MAKQLSNDMIDNIMKEHRREVEDRNILAPSDNNGENSLDVEVYFPDNEHSIEEGYCSWSGLVNLLRINSDKPEVVRFIADMME
ncbi:hypothetical protein [Pseudolactococcus reticulitermitis]|uniref:Uncharacterized protein n=1 Tax=Pseudolactococcus reticulitermitis TaxID=2025039 RepID=A0A224X395_9LACT|nr:hypothetical protein [Lactococcus reticulitermitis]GAX48517.1 hypothetical protein RsY01_2146 [Lactococcus reticulitermitis]